MQRQLLPNTLNPNIFALAQPAELIAVQVTMCVPTSNKPPSGPTLVLPSEPVQTIVTSFLSSAGVMSHVTFEVDWPGSVH